jgi:DNA polymerase III subunit gamma/tau
MTYQVLARKWRPQRFSELVGQEHVTKTLKNAIARERVAHAYLFVGSRGVGKTTAARLLAKSLNCINLVDGEPCDQCDSCRSILDGSSLDVIEIDGASNNGVDNIRELRETVNYMPSSGRYKIYIIDEVHMLSKSAWNALLKTLEEPPEHVKFIFATTEADKVLPTVVSRCQRFDFKFISPVLIEKKLREIADAEQISIDDSALAVIARAADGGMRDAQSIFDQMIAFCGGDSDSDRITESDVVDVFGMTSTSDLMKVIEFMYLDDISGLLVHINALSGQGRDLDRFFMELLNTFRNLLVIQCCQEYESILEINSSEIALLQKFHQYPAQQTRIFLDSLMVAEGSLRNILNKRIFLEVNLIRAMKEAHAVDINAVISAFTELKAGHLPRQQIVESLDQKKNENFSVACPLTNKKSEDYITPLVMDTEEIRSSVEESKEEQGGEEVESRVEEDYSEELSVDHTLAVQEISHSQPSDVPEPTYIPDEALSPQKEESTVPSASDVWHQLIEKLLKEPTSFELANVLKQMKPVVFEKGIFEADFSDDFDYRGHGLVTSAKKRIELLLAKISQVDPVNFKFKDFDESFQGQVQPTEVEKNSNSIVRNRVNQNQFVQYTCQAFSGDVIDARG